LPQEYKQAAAGQPTDVSHLLPGSSRKGQQEAEERRNKKKKKP
jgi:hypothetical protein